MSLYQKPFDPLGYLYSLRLDAKLGENGEIILLNTNEVPAHKWEQVRYVVSTYAGLLRMQLDAPSKEMRPSVRKLLAQGKIRVEKGEYIKG